MTVWNKTARVARVGLAPLAAVMALSGAPAQAAGSLEDYASPLKDVSAQSKIVKRDMDALKKISDEFAQSYRFASSKVYYKEPNKFRVDSKAGVVNVRYVINGDRKVLKAGVINKKWNIAKDPGKRQSALTVGLVTPAWARLLDAEHKGEKSIGGTNTVVFEAHYKGEPNSSYFKLFLDPERKYVVRSEQYHGDGRLKVTMDFVEPKKINGIWAPTRTKIYNAQGQLGAVTEVQDIRVNSGLSDDLFAL